MRQILIRWLLLGLVAFICTTGLSLLLLCNIPVYPYHVPPEPLHYDLPTEVPLRVAADAAEEIPTEIASRLPRLHLREYEPNRYELLFWGNPIRPRYTYSVTKLSTRKSVLADTDGSTQKWREISVITPSRQDGKLPLQPAVRLEKLKGKVKDFYAARISIHDGTTGTVLCSSTFLICGTEN